MIYVILALIVVVSYALWRSSASTPAKKNAAPTNTYKPKQKAKRVKVKKTKVAKSKAQANTSQVRTYRTEAINLHHPAHQSDDIALTDQALGLSTESVEKNINQGQPVVLYLVAPNDQPYQGFNLIQNLLSTGLKLHKNGMFDRVYQTPHRTEVLFRVASMQEPGTFPTDKVEGYETAGLVFYMEPGRDAQVFKQRFDAMMSQMTHVQSRIGGHIFTPEKTLLESHDFSRYADYLVNLDEVAQEA